MTDCVAQQTRSLPRDPDSRLETNGITLIGTTLLNNNHFEGDIQQIYLIPSPDAAYEQCYDYLPECSQPFPYEDLDNNGHEDNGNGYDNGNNGNEVDLDSEDNDRIDGSTDGSIDENIDSKTSTIDEFIPVTEPTVTPSLFTVHYITSINQTEPTTPFDSEVSVQSL